jgi:hypothetical protein
LCWKARGLHDPQRTALRCRTGLGWYLDRDFARIPLPRLREGENLLELSCAYKNSMQLEDCYLIGDFGVNCGRVMIPENPSIRTEDWTLQGYPHYAGSMIYSYESTTGRGVRNAYFKLGDCAATTVVTRVTRGFPQCRGGPHPARHHRRAFGRRDKPH